MKVLLINLNEIARPELKMRQEFEEQAMEELTESIKSMGLINPIQLKKIEKGYELLAGDRRLEAMKRLGWEKVPATVYASEGLESEKVKIAENTVRQDINPVDEGLYLLQIKEKYKCTQKELANMINRTESYVSDRLKATEWHPELKVAVKEGIINFSIARELSKLNDENQLFACMNSVVEYGTTPEQARKWVKDYKAQEIQNEAAGSYTDLSAEEQLLAPSVLLQSCQICKGTDEPRNMIYLTICRSCSDTIKKAM